MRNRTYGDLLALAGLALLALGLAQVALAHLEVKRAATWPMVTSEVISGRTEVVETTSKSGVSWTYHPILRYRYTVAGTVYTGDSAWLGRQPRFRSAAEAEALLAAYPKGAELTLRHDPAVPARSAAFLAVDHEQGWGLVIAGGIILLVGVALRRALRPSADRAPTS